MTRFNSVWPLALRRLAVLVAASMLALGAGTAPASAHTELVSSEPTDSDQLRSMPDQIVLTFNENISADFATVTLTPRGGNPTRLESTVAGGRVVAETDDEESVAPGRTRWTVAYRIVSEDGHPVTGKLGFVVRTEPVAQTPSPTPGSSPSAHVDSPNDSSSPSGDEESGLGSTAFGLLVLAALLLPLVVTVLFRPRRRSESS